MSIYGANTHFSSRMHLRISGLDDAQCTLAAQYAPSIFTTQFRGWLAYQGVWIR